MLLDSRTTVHTQSFKIFRTSSYLILTIAAPSICGRHAHKVAFQKSDLFFVCVLRPLSNNIKIDETEIQAAKVRTRNLFDQRWLAKPVSSI